MSRSGGVAPELGRKHQYVARNRGAIIKAAQLALIKFGPEVTVDQIAAEAHMALSTLYKHFANKEELCTIAVQTAFADWEAWKDEKLSTTADPMSHLVFGMRLFVRVGVTHPQYGELIIRNSGVIAQMLPHFTNQIATEVKALIKSGVLTMDNPVARVLNLTAVLYAILQQQLLSAKPNPAQADESIQIALTMFEILEKTSAKLMAAKLPI